MNKHLHSIGRTVLPLFLMGLFVVPQAFAQRGGARNPEQMRQRFVAQVDETIKALALEDSTAGKVREILMSSLDTRIKMMSEARDRGDFEAVRTKMQDLQKETEARLAGVLSEEQMARYRKIQQERSANRRGGRRGGN